MLGFHLGRVLCVVVEFPHSQEESAGDGNRQLLPSWERMGEEIAENDFHGDSAEFLQESVQRARNWLCKWDSSMSQLFVPLQQSVSLRSEAHDNFVSKY